MLIKSLTALPRVLAAALVGAITVVLMLAVIGRYTGLYTLLWAEEATRAMFLWAMLLGSAVAVERNGHFRLDALEKLLPPAGRRFMQAMAHASMCALGVALIVTGGQITDDSIGQYTTVLGLPQVAINVAVPAAGILILVYALLHIWRLTPAGMRSSAPAPETQRKE